MPGMGEKSLSSPIVALQSRTERVGLLCAAEFYTIEDLVAAGITDIGIVAGPTAPEIKLGWDPATAGGQ